MLQRDPVMGGVTAMAHEHVMLKTADNGGIKSARIADEGTRMSEGKSIS